MFEYYTRNIMYKCKCKKKTKSKKFRHTEGIFFPLRGGHGKKRERETHKSISMTKEFNKGYVIYSSDDLCVPDEYGEIVIELDAGSYGTVFKIGENKVIKVIPLNTPIPDKEDCNPFEMYDRLRACVSMDEEDFLREVKRTQQAGELGIGPRMYFSAVCNGTLEATIEDEEDESSMDYSIDEEAEENDPGYAKKQTVHLGIIIMEDGGISIKKYAKSYPVQYNKISKELKTESEELEQKLSKFFYHTDMHNGNILIKVDPYGDYIPGSMKLIDFGL
jgi:hypothetical protein